MTIPSFERRIDLVAAMLLAIGLGLPLLSKRLPIDVLAMRMAFFLVVALGLHRRATWAKFAAYVLFLLCAFTWFVFVTPLPAEREPSILEPIFGAPLPMPIYVIALVVGLLTFLLPIMILNRESKRFSWKFL